MNTKEQLISDILNKELKPIKKLLKDYQKQLDEIDNKGFNKEIHKGNRKPIYSGLNYTIGYCTGHIELTKKISFYLTLGYSEIIDLIKENDEIRKENSKKLKEIFKEAVTKSKNKTK